MNPLVRYLSIFRRSFWRSKIRTPESAGFLEENNSSTGIEDFLDNFPVKHPADVSKDFTVGNRSGGRENPERLIVQTSLPDITQWARSFDINKKPWLILGKGPSYQHIGKVNLSEFWVCSLNHVVREQRVDLAHVIDIDVVADCAQAIDRNAAFLALPFFPHVNHRPTAKSILDLVKEMPFLAKLEKEARLVWYNLSTSNRQVGSSPMIVAKFFSAESAVNILAECGAKAIRSLGVDGGNTYASHFEDLKTKTLLANTQTSFDGQFTQIATTIRTKKIFYAPLHVEAPIRVFVGTDKSQMLAANVLEYSIKKHGSMSVNVVTMCDLPVPLPTDPKNHPRTGFSFARFLIPSLCGYQGRAIYLDADMLVLSDIAKLWELPMNGADIACAEQPGENGRVRQYSVMLMNCSKLDWNIEDIVKGFDQGRYDYGKLMYDFCIVPPDRIAPILPYEWNSLEFYERGKTCLIHYTDMPTQPWVSCNNQHDAVWYQYLREAIREGFIEKALLYREVEHGYVRPDLPQQLGLQPHRDYERLAKSFVSPYRRFVRV
jgi:Glycosyl transferase family 8